MTLKDILNGSTLSPEEVVNNLKYKNLKNSIVDTQNSIKNEFFNTLQSIVEGVINDSYYNNYGCCNSYERRVIPEEDKKELIAKTYEVASEKLNNYKKTLDDLTETEISDEEPSQQTQQPETTIQIQKVEIPQAAAPSSDMFGY